MSLRGLYPRAEVRDTGEGFRFRQHTRGDDRVTITRVRIESAASVSFDLTTVVGVGQLRSGRLRAASNGTALDVSRPFVLRPGRVDLRASGTDLVIVALTLESLSRSVSEHEALPRRPLRFHGVSAASVASERSWSRALAHALVVFGDDSLLRDDRLRGATVDALHAAALAAFSGSDIEIEHRRPANPESIERALRYIDGHAAEAITVADIAQAARLSTRGLESAFRRTLDTTPMTRLRDVRLSATHADLLAGDSRTHTVADIARSWGFTNLGRFASHYRAAYDRLPRETLDQ